MRRFHESWFATYPNWIEYSIKEDIPFCFCCYSFKNNKFGHGGEDAFTRKRFKNSKKSAFDTHVGKVNSMYNQCVKKVKIL